jgi:hypothetical protein
MVGLSVPFLAVGLIALPLFIDGDRRAATLAGVFVALASLHLLVPVSGLHGYGPRFLFESMFALAVLGGRSLVLLATRTRPLARACAAVVVTVATVQNLYLLSTVLPRYEGYNGIRTPEIAGLRALGDEQAIFVMRGDGWQGMDIAVTLFDPTFAERIFIRELGNAAHARVWEALPDYAVFEVSGSTIGRVR